MQSADRVRWGVRVRGVVQGVGFRPAVYRVANRLGLGGFVRNDGDGVWAEIEGPAPVVSRFGAALERAIPPLARVDALEVHALEPRGGGRFEIVATERSAGATRIPVDVAPCEDCVRELFDPRDRRYRYPFINCTACGPRYSIIRQLPYDRERTTMAAFAMCRRCRAEYADPGSRRFHAEPNACADCGPRLKFVEGVKAPKQGEEALQAAIACLRAGKIVAVRGVGGFLLAADANSDQVVTILRQRKRRPHKPFALLARDLATVEDIAHVDAASARELQGPARPIVLLPARRELAAVAPGLAQLGVMLPSMPLHHLLAEALPLLVMTSGNRVDEPPARENQEARARLEDVADAFLLHDRPIHTRVDDSVVRIVGGTAQPARRARGLAPDPIVLPFAAPCVLAVGGELKNTLCVTRGNEAFLSQHLGDLSQPACAAWFEETVAKLLSLYELTPGCIAHDLHPDYRSTRWALAQALPRVAVQHHHAHIASCLAENQHLGPTIGVAFDGTGCGPAGELWGGEFLVCDLAGFRRLGHLRPLPLAGGEIAIRQPWRLAAAALADAGLPVEIAGIEQRRVDAVRRLMTPQFAPLSSSAGRWFDAAAALLGVRSEISYEAQACIELESLAGDTEAAPLPFVISDQEEPFVVDLRPCVRALDRRATRQMAAAFHETMAQVVLAGCLRARERTGLDTVALSGGCFQNARLTARCRELLRGFTVLVHRRVPPNDGGLSLGQAAIAAYRRSECVSASRVK